MKRCLIVVDYQNDFVTGSLGNEMAAALEEGIAARIRACRAQGDDILFTLDTHEEDYMSTREGRYLPVPHCIRDTDGHALYGKVAAECHADDHVFCKETFGSKGLFDFLRHNRYDAVELCGVVTNICVISNAVIAKTALPEADVAVNAALCASNDPELHQKALDVMASFQIDVI
ncbi:MAG: cysteine hydrolase [Clostridia bacterium]|nr:cysteine hydrolase [Clostridia bacterium]